MFTVGDRVRVVKFMGITGYSSHIGATGIVTKCVSAKPDSGFVYSYHVRLDRPQKIASSWSKQEAIDILYYPEELEYEDNRDRDNYGDLIAYNNDYVRLTNGMENCKVPTGSNHPLKNVFLLFANYRVGDSALHLRCMGCGDVIGTVVPAATPADADNYMYMNNQPSWPDVNTRLE